MHGPRLYLAPLCGRTSAVGRKTHVRGEGGEGRPPGATPWAWGVRTQAVLEDGAGHATLSDPLLCKLYGMPCPRRRAARFPQAGALDTLPGPSACKLRSPSQRGAARADVEVLATCQTGNVLPRLHPTTVLEDLVGRQPWQTRKPHDNARKHALALPALP